MKKTKIILFTLLLSIMEGVGSTNAASVNSSSRGADLMPSAASQLIQNSSLSKNNIENPNNGKCILWSPRMRNFKKGDQVKILLPNGKYTGKTLTIKIVDHGEEIATLTVECGCDYGIITFMVDANSDQISQIIAGFGSMDFGAVSAGGVIDIGGGMTGGCTGNTASRASVAPAIGFSSSLSNRNDDNLGSLSKDPHSSSIKATSSLSLRLSSSSLSKVPAKIDHSSKKLPNVSKKVKPAHKNTKTKDEPAKAKTVKAAKTNAKAESHLAWKESVASLPKKQATKSAVWRVSQQNGSPHLNPQQIQALKHEMHFSNSKAAEAVKKLDTSALHGTIHGSAATPNNSKQGLTLKHWNAAHPGSNVRRITLPIQGILPATRMDSYTWVYSLVGLAIMIVSGRAFFSKKRK